MACQPAIQGAQGGSGDSSDCGDCQVPTCQAGSNACSPDGDVVACNQDGTLGDIVESCDESCSNGHCVPFGTGGSDCAAGAGQAIYVVDDTNTLYAFDPDSLSFTSIGQLSCPSSGHPFSMSVDRSAIAWVFYDTGELFRVSTQDASCTATALTVPPAGFRYNGMGFASDPGNEANETLFVIGTNSNDFSGVAASLGSIDTSSAQLHPLVELGQLASMPELTGTSEGRLFGYFPGAPSYVSEIDRSSGQQLGNHWPAGSVAVDDLVGWAFAHWAGKYYVFESSGYPTVSSRVILVDPAGAGGQGTATVVRSTGVPLIVGAGVSTCAPVVVE